MPTNNAITSTASSTDAIKNTSKSTSNADSNAHITTILSGIDHNTTYRRLTQALSKIEARTLVLIISPLDGAMLDDVAKAISSDISLVSICVSAQHAQEYTLDKSSQLYKSKIPLLYGNFIETGINSIIESAHIQNCKVIYYSSEAYNYRQEAESLWYNCMNAIKQHWANHATTSYFGAKWLHNIWQNLDREYAYGIPFASDNLADNLKANVGSNLAASALETTANFAIVVGAGPSLTPKVLEFIAKTRDKCTIFAADTALPTLQKYAIVPHFCVLLESQYYNMVDLLPAPHPDTIAIGDICCYPASLRAFKRTACICSQFAPISFFTTHREVLPPLIPPLGSVGLLSLYLAIHFGARYIFLAGLDFSYYKGLSHSLHAASYTKWQNTHSRVLPWLHANAHFANPALQYTSRSQRALSVPSPKVAHYMSTSQNTTTSTPTRVQDASLQGFRQKLEQGLVPFARQRNSIFLDLNSESILQGVSPIALEKAQKLVNSFALTHRILWKPTIHAKQQEEYFPSWQALQQATGKQSKSILQQELQLCKYVQQRMKVLAEQNILPQDEDWAKGLDNYTFMLPEDPYLLKTDLALWKKNNIYSKIFAIASKIEQDTRQALAS